ncbi:MAG: hypothetical protein AAFV07_12540, partial [Bacteroidota bacterium]
IEVIMALALTGFVLMMGFTLLRIFQQTHIRYRQKVNEAYTLSLVERELQQQIPQATRLQWLPAPDRGLALLNKTDSLVAQFTWLDSTLAYQKADIRDTFTLRGTFSMLPDSQTLIWYDSLRGLEHKVYLFLSSQALP